NHYGRPLEFQCTLPVRANPTQQILYGPTLVPFILGELIGGTLVEKSGIKPQLVLTDQEQILELRNHIEQPVVLVAAPPLEVGERSDSEASQSIKLGQQIVRFPPAHSDDHATVARESQHIPPDADLREPFQRVREALEETLRSGALR